MSVKDHINTIGTQHGAGASRFTTVWTSSTALHAAVHPQAAVHTSPIVRGTWGNCAASFRSFAPMNEATTLCDQPIMGQHKCRLRPISMEAPADPSGRIKPKPRQDVFDYCSLTVQKDPGVPVQI
jgi:hypothetical protein